MGKATLPRLFCCCFIIMLWAIRLEPVIGIIHVNDHIRMHGADLVHILFRNRRILRTEMQHGRAFGLQVDKLFDLPAIIARNSG